ncbi:MULTISPECIES: hypothetical protein [Brucella]|uniref:Uncharacterized protein n=1 Tax=Brucella lupini TaxID=255457 RepID=A0A256GVY4_9HYPH|nr:MULTISPECIES: hypothetical protein [Brucella]MCR8490545.1 hypothetical protein [Brucella anthropi]OYR31374.1 hypothetical protein CES86_0866 [Brucella lupini]
MAYAAVLHAREMASKEMDTFRAAIKLSDDQKKAKAAADAERVANSTSHKPK